TKAEATLERATQVLEAAEADFEKNFGDLNERIASAKADQLRLGKSGPVLLAARTARTSALEHVDETKAALSLLEAERAAAEKRLREAVEAESDQAFEVLMQ